MCFAYAEHVCMYLCAVCVCAVHVVCVCVSMCVGLCVCVLVSQHTHCIYRHLPFLCDAKSKPLGFYQRPDAELLH